MFVSRLSSKMALLQSVGRRAPRIQKAHLAEQADLQDHVVAVVAVALGVL